MNILGFTSIWSSAAGPIQRLSPSARILCGVSLFLSILVADPASRLGLAFWLLAVSGWLLAVRPPPRVVFMLLALALVMLGPLVLLTPWVAAPAHADAPHLLVSSPWHVSWRILLRGTGAMLISVSTASALSLPDLSNGLRHLHAPRALVDLLMQIVHQLHALGAETMRMSEAIRLRSADAGFGVRLRLAVTLPLTWLPRVLFRSIRVTEAMELRGYTTQDQATGSTRFRRSDALAIGASVAFLGVAIAVRAMEAL